MAQPNATCSYPGCTAKTYARLLCVNHYAQMRLHGTMHAVRPHPGTRLDHSVEFFVTDELHEHATEAAGAAGLSLSSWLRSAMEVALKEND